MEAFQLAATARTLRDTDNLRGALHLWILQAGTQDLRAAEGAYRLAADLYAQGREDRRAAGLELQESEESYGFADASASNATIQRSLSG